MSTPKKTTAVLMFALACCLLSGCQPTTVTDSFDPGLTEPDLLTLDQWELEAVDELGPEPPVIRNGPQVHLPGRACQVILGRSGLVDRECLPAIRNRLFA